MATRTDPLPTAAEIAAAAPQTFTRVVWVADIDAPTEPEAVEIAGAELSDWYGRNLLAARGRRLDPERVLVTAQLGTELRWKTRVQPSP